MVNNNFNIGTKKDLIKPPRISIVTPSYNQGEFLEECIDSILSQNYPNLEYVIMDGGSTDNSPEIIKKYEKYLTYWQSKPDGGQYAAIDEGFKKTSGEIMTWLNSDDKYHHQALFKVAFIFSHYKNIEWIMGRPTLWDKDGKCSYILCEFLPTFSRDKYLHKDYMEPCIQQESTFWCRSLWEKAGSRILTDVDYAGDMELWMRFFRHAQLHTVNTLLGGYRKHGNQKANLFMDKYIEEAEIILDEEIERFNNGIYTDIKPMPEPLTLDYKEVKIYINTIYSSTQHTMYKISDDSHMVTDFILKRLIETEIDRKERLEIIDNVMVKWEETETNRAAAIEWYLAMKQQYEELSCPEGILKAALVLLFKKLHVYDFYIRHEPSFSRIYHFFRKIIVPGKKTFQPNVNSPSAPNAVVSVEESINSPMVEALIRGRSLEGGMDEHALCYLYEMGATVRNILCINPTSKNIQALYMLSKGGAKVTLLASSKHRPDLLQYGFAMTQSDIMHWLRDAGHTILADYDGLLLDTEINTTDLNLLKGRLWPHTKIFINGKSSTAGALETDWGVPDHTINDLGIHTTPPETWLDPACKDKSFYTAAEWPWKQRTISMPPLMPSGRPWPKISIVTVTLNQGSYLEETLLSVLMQGYPNLEYIVIDGGSTDNTSEILERYRNELTHCISEKDKGQSDALNKGFHLATGDILAWINSDDCYLPGTLCRVALTFDTYDTDMVAGGCALRQGNDPTPFKTHHNALPIGQVVPLPLDRLLDLDGSWQKGDFFFQPEVFWSRTIWEQSGRHVNEALFYSMDYEFWVRLAKCGARILHIPDTLTLFRLHEKQKTSGDDMPFLPELRKLNAELKRSLKCQ